ncbi:MAG: DUF401 family protein [Spirochaetales bacterium]|nr:DUF401 family protein [Spirochaetales bacterium]
MDLLMNIPVVIKILVSLGVILVGNKIVKNLSVALVLGILILSFWSGHSLSSIGKITWARFSSINGMFLFLLIYLVIALSTQMKKTGNIDELVIGVQSRMSRRSAMAVLPALIGLLPMPGGAVFSAPLVDSCDSSENSDSILKGRINYWFRHIWEFWWPLYPGVLLAIELSGLRTPVFSTLMFPMTLCYIFGGYFFLLRKVPKDEKTERKKEGSILKPLTPIMITLGVYLLVMIFFPSLSKFSQYIPMTIGIGFSIIYLQIRRPVGPYDWKEMLLSSRSLQLLILVMLIRVYGAFIEAPLPDGMFLMEKMREELFSWGIPVILFTMLIPFFSGIATGIAIGTVGASMPIVLSLMGPEPALGVQLSTILLAYSFGHAGMMLSPVHVCLIVTNQYFKTGVFRSLKGLIRPAAVVMVSALIVSRIVLILF